MCGILGAWSRNVELSDVVVRTALDKMHNRGPDDRGYEYFSAANSSHLVLGHTRLSIIDLTSGGHQPMSSANARFHIVFNGEIYNYKELRQELIKLGYSFSTESDTEVLLSAWQAWGHECLVRLIGMFAFVVYDNESLTITCVRDAFGIKPLFYSHSEQSLSFASELPALIALLPTKPILNWQRSYDYLVHGDYDSTPETFYEDVYNLPPGHWLQINTATGQLASPQRWWQPQIKERAAWRFDDAAEQVREQFLQNVRLHLRSDVPLGAALSGGVDSSAVVCAMRHLEPDMPIHTFSFIAEGSDVNEEHWVDRVNAHVRATPHKVRVSPQELVRDLDDMIQSQGEPFGSTSICAQYRVYQLTRENGITVSLDGQGADEMLAGYSGYPGQRLKSLIETGQLTQAWRFLNDWAAWPGRSKAYGLKALAGQLTAGRVYNVLRSFNGDKVAPVWINAELMKENGVALTFPNMLPQQSEPGRRVIDELSASLSTRGLVALLRHGDRNSMRFSIESRVPFLTTDLVDLLLSMPEDFLIAPKGETKHVFRAAMRGIVPDDVLDRKDKIGFATPEKDWLMAMSSTIRKWLSEPMDLPFIDQSKMLHEFDRIVAGKAPFSWQVWRWVIFCRWYSSRSISY